MKIRHLFGVFAVAAVALLIVFFAALFQYRSAVKDGQEALQQQYDSYLLANGLRQGSQDLTRLVRTYVATGDKFYKDEYFRILDIRGGKVPTPVDYYKRIYWSFLEAGEPAPFPDGDSVSLHDRMASVGITDDEFKLLDEAVANSDGLVKLETQAMELVEKTPSSVENTLAATALVNSKDYHKFVADIMRPVDKFYVKMGARVQSRIEESASAVNVTFFMMLASALSLAFVLAGFGALMNKRVLGGIARLREDMMTVANGKLSIEIHGDERQDEIGDMAKTLAKFKTSAIDRQKLEANAKTDREAYERQQDAIHHSEAEKAAELQMATSHIGEGLKRLASGDLSFQLMETFAPDFEPLRHDFNSSVTQLANTLASVSQSVIAISNGSAEIATGANDLSKRTEQQAASLEQTAAALDEITVNVTSSSKRVEDARQVAAKANASATRSGEVVAQAVDAMSRIESSSNQISNIIGVIDEIAFQTNLLALNAGVEAARAGDAGKGFAVVAQEVRELAQRSAGAAKEIKGLIQASSTEVSTGVKLVSDTGEVLKSIGEFIVNINEHMESIAVSAREQSTGLAEVNTAVNQMDQTTQQNAAMVEESSAAAATLTNETNNLRQLIEQFALVQSGSHVKALRQTAQRMGSANGTEPASRSQSAAGNTALAKDWAEF